MTYFSGRVSTELLIHGPDIIPARRQRDEDAEREREGGTQERIARVHILKHFGTYIHTLTHTVDKAFLDVVGISKG